jgi:hypothetical protein
VYARRQRFRPLRFGFRSRTGGSCAVGLWSNIQSGQGSRKLSWCWALRAELGEPKTGMDLPLYLPLRFWGRVDHRKIDASTSEASS